MTLNAEKEKSKNCLIATELLLCKYLSLANVHNDIRYSTDDHAIFLLTSPRNIGRELKPIRCSLVR